jgi:acetyl esterase/lipase
LQLAALTADPPDPTVVAEPLVYRRRGPKGPLRLRLYAPRNNEPASRGLVIYLHGGGWVAGDLDTHDGVCRALAIHSGCKVIAVDYRRPPEHRFPAAVEDAVDVVTWARSRAARFGADRERLVLAGDSAGANLAAAATGLLLSRGAAPIRLLALLCPILEMAPLHPSRRTFAEGYFLDPAQMAQDLADYLGDPAEAVSPLASPLRLADLSGFPATCLHLAQYDPFRDEALAFAARLTDAGVLVQAKVHPGMIHYFYALPGAIAHARVALAEMGAQIAAAAG